MRHESLVPASLGIAAAALALSAPAAARTIRGWEVGRNRDFCMMQSSFQDNVTLAFVWHPQSGELGFMVEGTGAVEQHYRDWKARGLPIAQELTTMDFGPTFVVLDPDGHRLRVCEPDK